MGTTTLQHLLDQVRSGQLSRRGFMGKAAALGLSTAAAGTMVQQALAQDASPEAASPIASPVGTGEAIRSITRAEYFQQLKEHYAIEEARNPGGQFVHTYTTDISTLNPIVASDTYSQMIVGWIYEGLVGTSMIDGSIVPSGLADYWEIAEDGVTYTVHLNPDATWQDGVPVTADDVVFTIDAVVAENSPSIRTAVVNEFLAGHEKVDDHTVRLISRQPSAVFLNRTVNQFAIMPKHIWEDVPLEEMASDPGSTGQDISRVVGSGPFRLGEWQLGSRVVLERNADYWDQDNVPYIDQYIFNVVEDANAQVASLQTGDTDLAGITSGQVDALRESNPELQFAEYDTGTMNIFFFNHSSEKFSDVQVRQAMSYAVDKEVFANVIQDGYAVPAAGTIPPISPAYNPDVITNPYPYDPELAGQLLEEAGWVLGDDGIRVKDGERFSFELTYASTTSFYTQGVPYIQQCWREIGVEAIPTAIPFPTQLEQLDAGEGEAAMMQFSWNPDGFQGSMFYCDSTPPNGFNWMGWCNEEYEALDEQAMSELDDERRYELLQAATNVVNDDAAVGVLTFSRGVAGAQPRVKNFHPLGLSVGWWIRYTWLDEES